jgi:hypothetical protein
MIGIMHVEEMQDNTFVLDREKSHRRRDQIFTCFTNKGSNFQGHVLNCKQKKMEKNITKTFNRGLSKDKSIDVVLFKEKNRRVALPYLRK